MTSFRNPYNFIPLGQPAKDGPLGQHSPAGHDRYHDDKWSGRIEVEIAAVTPLLIPDARGIETDTARGGHKTFDLRRDSQGRPLLPPTSLKGALRSAFEAVTNSRLGVFQGHDAPPARRMDAREGLAMVPARVSDDGEHLELLLGSHAGLPWRDARPIRKQNRWWLPEDTVYAAWLRQYDKDKGGFDRTFGISLEGGGWPTHGQKVECWVELWQKGPFKYWKVRAIATTANAAKLVKLTPSLKGYGLHEPVSGEKARLELVSGWVVKTNQNFSRKHDERVFFALGGSVTRQPLQQGWCNRYIDLVRNYQQTHKEDVAERRRNRRQPDVFYGKMPGQTAWSRHVYETAEARLSAGDLVYARVDTKGDILDLFPVMISRELGHVSPAQMLPAQFHPATALELLSPADRVFGWVSQKGAGAYKGQLRIRSVACTSAAADAVDTFSPPLPLAILGAPKVAQARFYVGEQGGTPLALNEGETLANSAYFENVASGAAPKRELRGRKVYPHHAAAAAVTDYWKKSAAEADAAARVPYGGAPTPAGRIEGQSRWREYVRRKGSKQDGTPIDNADSQNRSIKAWVKPGTRFKAVIDVINLNAAELGLLLWLLDLPRCEGGSEPVPHHRIGGGKPLGFGSATIRITGLDLTTGTARRTRYTSLFSEPGAAPAGINERIEQGLARLRDGEAGGEALGKLTDALLKKAFTAVHGAWGQTFWDVPHIAAFLQAARGYADGLPTHYPRTSAHPDPAGENFRWFAANADPLPAVTDENTALTTD